MEYPENLTIKSDSVETYNRTKKKKSIRKGEKERGERVRDSLTRETSADFSTASPPTPPRA